MELDFIFSIGPACRPAYHLKQNFLRIASSPLDWQMSYSLDTCLKLFETSFSSFFATVEEYPYESAAKNCRRVIDCENSIISLHHFKKDISLSDAQCSFRKKMAKRFATLNNAILEASTVGLLCNRADSIETLSTFLYNFSNLYPKQNFILINIRNADNISTIQKYEYTISSRLTIREYLFRDTYDSVPTTPSNAWLGNTEKWDQLLSEYRLTKHPFIDYLTKQMMTRKNIVLYGAGTYCRKVIHFMAKYNISPSAILVTSPDENPNSLENIPVLSLDEYKRIGKNSIVIISIWNPVISAEISIQLKELGFTDVYKINSNLQFVK